MWFGKTRITALEDAKVLFVERNGLGDFPAKGKILPKISFGKQLEVDNLECVRQTITQPLTVSL